MSRVFRATRLVGQEQVALSPLATERRLSLLGPCNAGGLLRKDSLDYPIQAFSLVNDTTVRGSISETASPSKTWNKGDAIACVWCGSPREKVGTRCSFCAEYLDARNLSYDIWNRRDPAIIRLIVESLRNGYSPAHAARRAGTYKEVAQGCHWNLRAVLRRMPNCPCGKPSMHVGHCDFRVINDPLWRQWLRVKLERTARKEREREARILARTERLNERMKLLSNSTIGTVWRQEPGIKLIRGQRCEEKACPFSVEPGSRMCRYHKNFYAYDESLTGNYLDESDIEYSWKEGSWKEGRGAGLSVVYAGEPRLYFVRRGYVQNEAGE